MKRLDDYYQDLEDGVDITVPTLNGGMRVLRRWGFALTVASVIALMAFFMHFGTLVLVTSPMSPSSLCIVLGEQTFAEQEFKRVVIVETMSTSSVSSMRTASSVFWRNGAVAFVNNNSRIGQDEVTASLFAKQDILSEWEWKFHADKRAVVKLESFITAAILV